MRFLPGLRPGPRCGSSWRSTTPSRLGDTLSHTHPTRRLRRLDSRAFGARHSAPSAPRFGGHYPQTFSSRTAPDYKHIIHVFNYYAISKANHHYTYRGHWWQIAILVRFIFDTVCILIVRYVRKTKLQVKATLAHPE